MDIRLQIKLTYFLLAYVTGEPCVLPSDQNLVLLRHCVLQRYIEQLKVAADHNKIIAVKRYILLGIRIEPSANAYIVVMLKELIVYIRCRKREALRYRAEDSSRVSEVSEVVIYADTFIAEQVQIPRGGLQR